MILFFIMFTCGVAGAKESVKDDFFAEKLAVAIDETKEIEIKNHKKDHLANLYVRIAQQTLEKINRTGSTKTLALISSKIDRVDALVKQKTLTILSVLAGDFQSLTNRITRLENKVVDLTALIKNLAIVNQIGLIHTTAANSALATTLVVSDSGSEVMIYNTAIANALLFVQVAIHAPSKENTQAAQVALAVVLADFRIVIVQDRSLSVISLYSLAEIYTTLMELDAQLAYLKSLQDLCM